MKAGCFALVDPFQNLDHQLRLAADLGVAILLEPHGPLTDTIKGMQAIINTLSAPENLGVNMDTGNSWLGGSDPVEFAKTFRDRIRHIHWKDLPAGWEKNRGKMFGFGCIFPNKFCLRMAMF